MKTQKEIRETYKNLSLENFISGRACHEKTGWQEVPELELVPEDIAELTNLFGFRARSSTKAALQFAFENSRTLKPYGIYNRIQWNSSRGWSYCACQDYPLEISQIRALLVKS
ncbi:MAG: hypothetical protein WC567_03890 [Kiritimatiellia bacterium]|jgi:hypothetical protein